MNAREAILKKMRMLRVQKLPLADRILGSHFPFPVLIQGFWMKPVGIKRWLMGAHEPDVTALCKRIVKKGDVVADIGASSGYFTLLFSKLVGTSGRVIAFEPDNDLLKDIRLNLKRNGLSNVEVVNGAILDRKGKVKFFASDNKGTGSILYRNKGGGEWREVEAFSLDDYFAAAPFDFFKIDIEGGEGLALRGMEGIIREAKAKRRSLSGVVEFSPYILESIGVKPEDFLNQVRSYGFQISTIANDGSANLVGNKELIEMAAKKKHVNIFINLPKNNGTNNS